MFGEPKVKGFVVFKSAETGEFGVRLSGQILPKKSVVLFAVDKYAVVELIQNPADKEKVKKYALEALRTLAEEAEEYWKNYELEIASIIKTAIHEMEI